jgi:hypothetical protein
MRKRGEVGVGCLSCRPNANSCMADRRDEYCAMRVDCGKGITRNIEIIIIKYRKVNIT